MNKTKLFEAVRMQTRNKKEFSKVAYYYTKKNGQKVMVACRDLNSDLVRYYVASWVYKYPSIHTNLINYLRFICLNGWFDVKDVYDIEATFKYL